MNLDEKIFLAGANGMVGKCNKKDFNKKRVWESKFRWNDFCPSRKQLDLLNYNDLEDWYKLNKPTVVIIRCSQSWRHPC